MTWNDCPICGNELSLLDGASLKLKCNSCFNYEVGFIPSGHIIWESCYAGKYELLRDAMTSRNGQFMIYRNDKPILEINIIASPKITEQYIDNILTFL